MTTGTRLFQHYEGEIAEIEGLILNGLRLLVDDESEEENVILFWIQTQKSWLRIFIDGTYCGIDEYETNESDDDIDEGVSFRNKDNWVKGLTIKKAWVKSEKLPLIDLIIDFTNGSQLVLSCDDNQNCRFNGCLVI